MRRTTLAVVALLLTAFAGQALADGFIVVPPHPPRRPEVRTVPLAVKYHRVAVTITDQVATTEIDQVFINPNPYQLEGTYIFPLPEGASISAFSMWIDGKEMPGEVLERQKARKIYEDIVRSMRDPALLEYAGREMFKASIFPIPARGEKRVKLRYQEICPADGGLVRYRYPLNTEKFSSAPLQDVSVVVDIKGKMPIKNITCPTHPVEVVKKSETAARVAWEDRNVTPDRDLVLYYSLSPDEFAMNFVTHRPKADEDGYFMLLLSPGTESGKVIPKDVCFVVDTSGSMQGKKIEQARAALRFCVQSLNAGDRFNLIPFATEAQAFSSALLPASQENVAKALEFVAGMKALGGTAIDEALTKALDMSPNSDRPYMIVFLTDGLPTIGDTREPMILEHVKERNRGNVRLFAFGVGNDVNTHLLDKLAEQNRGARDYVSESEDLELKISTFYTKVANPVLSDLSLEFPGLRVTDVYPKRLPDLFKGSQLVVVGRYPSAGAKAVKLSGRVGGEEKTIAHDVVFPKREDEHSFLPRLWAIRKIGYLLDEIRLHGETQELRDEVVRLARLHGIVTPYTSFLVLEDQRRRGFANRVPAGATRGPAGEVPPGARDPADPGTPPGDMGAGEADSAGAAAPAAPAFGRGGGGGRAREAEEGMRRATGGASVRASKDAAKMKGEASEGSDDGLVPDAGREEMKDIMRLIEGVAFYRRGDVWYQGDLADLARKLGDRLVKKEVKIFSDEYFELLGKGNKKIALYLALGKVDFVSDGVHYSVR